MASLFDRIGNVRDRLRHPRANRPGDADCLRALCDHTKLLRAKRKNTGRVWDYADKRINVLPNKAKYLVNDIRFGTPLAVLTIDDANSQHFQRIIPFYCPQNLAFNWGLPMDAGAYVSNLDGSNHSAERVAFYWASGVAYCEFQPIPRSACTYVLRFVVGDSVDAMSLSDPLALGEVGDSLAEVYAAISMLPFSDYEDDQDENREKRKELGTTLDWEGKMLNEQFMSSALIESGSTLGHLWMPE